MYCKAGHQTAAAGATAVPSDEYHWLGGGTSGKMGAEHSGKVAQGINVPKSTNEDPDSTDEFIPHSVRLYCSTEQVLWNIYDTGGGDP